MKRIDYSKILLAALLNGIVLLTVSVQEVHYLFTSHKHIEEECENHLHNNDEHRECAVCKFAVSLFTDVLQSQVTNNAEPLPSRIAKRYKSRINPIQLNTNTFRGPPILFC